LINKHNKDNNNVRLKTAINDTLNTRVFYTTDELIIYLFSENNQFN
jgi:hypothetical protein